MVKISIAIYNDEGIYDSIQLGDICVAEVEGVIDDKIERIENMVCEAIKESALKREQQIEAQGDL